jgi:hypothetical protein
MEFPCLQCSLHCAKITFKRTEHFLENHLHTQVYEFKVYGFIFVLTSVRKTVILMLLVTVNLEVPGPGRRGDYVTFTENPRVTWFTIVRWHSHAEYRVNIKYENRLKQRCYFHIINIR